MRSILEQEGLSEIEAVDKEFDPQLHHAVVREETSEYPEDQIIGELQKGYNEQEKQLAELRNALVNADKELDIFNEDAVCDHSVGICWCSYIRMRDDIKKAITQSSDKWLNEQKAKALEELADWFNAEEQDAWEIAGEIRNKASELRSKT